MQEDNNNKLQIDLESSFYYQHTFRLSTASLAQIILALDKTSDRIQTPTNDYQKVLYPKLKELIPPIIEKFKSVLSYKSEKGRSVKFYNVGGKLPVEIKAIFHKNIKLGTGNFGPLVDAGLQRTQYILTRPTPKMYENDAEYLENFEQLKNDLK